MGYQPRTYTAKVDKVNWLQTTTVFWLGGVSISRSYKMYMRLMLLGRQNYTHTN